MHRRTIRVGAVVLLIVVIGIGLFKLFYTAPPSHDTVIRYFDDVLQSTTMSKPFIYSIASMRNPEISGSKDNIWCIVIDSTFERRDSVQGTHFVVSLQNSEWITLLATDSDRRPWTEQGCGDW